MAIQRFQEQFCSLFRGFHCFLAWKNTYQNYTQNCIVSLMNFFKMSKIKRHTKSWLSFSAVINKILIKMCSNCKHMINKDKILIIKCRQSFEHTSYVVALSNIQCCLVCLVKRWNSCTQIRIYIFLDIARRKSELFLCRANWSIKY